MYICKDTVKHIRRTNIMQKYKATIELDIPKDFDMEGFESKLDDLARNLAEQYDAKIRIGNFFNGRNWYGGSN
tara:strand:- start:54 stop:272 length:219 start_codon:yes stop_codon:yes gene_type:complete